MSWWFDQQFRISYSLDSSQEQEEALERQRTTTVFYSYMQHNAVINVYRVCCMAIIMIVIRLFSLVLLFHANWQTNRCVSVSPSSYSNNRSVQSRTPQKNSFDLYPNSQFGKTDERVQRYCWLVHIRYPCDWADRWYWLVADHITFSIVNNSCRMYFIFILGYDFPPSIVIY